MHSKITVRDSDKEFHIFKGEGIEYRRDGNFYDIFCYIDGDDGDKRRKNLGSFTAPIWVKKEELKPEEAPARKPRTFETRTDDHADPFTQAALAKRAPDKPDFSKLADHSPIDIPAPQDDAQVDEPETAHEDPPEPETASSGPEIAEEPQRSFDDLKEQYGTPPTELALADTTLIQDMADKVMDPEIREVDIDATLAEAEERHQQRKKEPVQ